jgi:hypothetical protein
MGSGSTLLRLILDSHERIAIPQETGFMRAYNAHAFIPLKWSGRNWARRMGWSREELDAELAAFYDRIFRRYVERQGAARWGDKTPLHTWHVDAMARLFPDAVFIGIIRHPGGAVGSNMNRFGHSYKRAVTHVGKYQPEIARQAARHRDRFVLVRYEELVLWPEALLRELLDWLGEPWSQRVLEHHVVQTGRGTKVTVEGKNRIDDPIDVSRIDKWHRLMPPGQRRALGRRLGRLAEFYGYSMDDPARLERIAPEGSLLIRGADVHARIDRFPELGLRTQGEVPLAESFYHPGKMQLHRVGEGAPARTPAVPPPDPSRRALLAVWRRIPRRARRRVAPAARRALRRAARLRRRVRGRATRTTEAPSLPRAVEDTIARVRAEHLTYLGADRLRDLARAVHELEVAGTPGLVVEAGAARGGSAIVLAAAKSPERAMKVYDVFGLIPAPTARDGADVHARYETIVNREAKGPGGETYYGYRENLLDEVTESFARHGLPLAEHRVELVQGLFEDTIDLDEPVAFAHLDGDWYESTMTCLTRIAPLLVPGGRIVLDDYYHWSGCRAAVDEYFAGRDGFRLEHGARLHAVRV